MARDIPSVRSLEISFLKIFFRSYTCSMRATIHHLVSVCSLCYKDYDGFQLVLGICYEGEPTRIDTAVCTTVAGTDQKCSLVRMMIKRQRRSLGVEQCDMPLSAIISELAL